MATMPSNSTDRFSPSQSRLLVAICDRVVPPGPDGPSASEAHVCDYIHRQLAGPWGMGARMYRHGPFFQPVDPGHGWQSSLTPAEVYASGLSALERHIREAHGAELAELSAADQDEVLRGWSAGEVSTFTDVDGAAFFEMVRQNVVEGLLCDPSYGGNHDMVGWRWLGYPGVASAHGDYADQIERHGTSHAVEPRALEPRKRA